MCVSWLPPSLLSFKTHREDDEHLKVIEDEIKEQRLTSLKSDMTHKSVFLSIYWLNQCGCKRRRGSLYPGQRSRERASIPDRCTWQWPRSVEGLCHSEGWGLGFVRGWKDAAHLLSNVPLHPSPKLACQLQQRGWMLWLVALKQHATEHLNDVSAMWKCIYMQQKI